MTLQITLSTADTDKLAAVLTSYNASHPEDQLTYQELATQLLSDAIWTAAT